jgi:hypothetical protein
MLMIALRLEMRSPHEVAQMSPDGYQLTERRIDCCFCLIKTVLVAATEGQVNLREELRFSCQTFELTFMAM